MNQDIQLFKAAFYADLNALKSLVTSKEGLSITVAVKEGDYKLYWGSEFVTINVLDILNWAATAFYEETLSTKDLDEKHNISIEDSFTTAKYHLNVVSCIDWICSTFSIVNFHLKDYSSFRLLRHFLMPNENWLADDERKIALEKGYKQIDLDLINEAEKGNGIACCKLIKKGASPNIDPIEHTDSSAIIGMLASDISFYTSSLENYVMHEDDFESSDAYDMITSLYCVGVSKYILDIIRVYPQM